MNCAYHADRPVQAICSKCGRPICDECQVEVEGQVFCRPCAGSQEHATSEPEPPRARPARENVGILRFILSVAPGLGHLYLGLFNRGVQLMAGAILGVWVLGAVAPGPLPVFFAFATIAFSIFDAREAHLRMEQGLEVEDKAFVDLRQHNVQWDNRYVGYILIGIGVLALYNTLLYEVVPYHYRGEVRGVTLGLLALGAGLWMLRRDKGQTSR